MDNLTQECQLKEFKINDLQKGMKSMEAHNVATKTKLREAEDSVQKLEGAIYPKVKETVTRQKDLSKELEKIHLDA